jgi:hypothetical protein
MSSAIFASYRDFSGLETRLDSESVKRANDLTPIDRTFVSSNSTTCEGCIRRKFIRQCERKRTAGSERAQDTTARGGRFAVAPAGEVGDIDGKRALRDRFLAEGGDNLRVPLFINSSRLTTRRSKPSGEERFQKPYGFWRGFTDKAPARYLDCGRRNRGGFARLRCEDCREAVLLTFSCLARGLCPSCDAKRAAAFKVDLNSCFLG